MVTWVSTETYVGLYPSCVLTLMTEPDGQRPGTLYNITSAPVAGLNNKTFPVSIGCVVGGSSAVNGMVFQRGNAKDYDVWGELGGGNPRVRWNWVDMLKYFKKSIQMTAPKPETAAFDLRYDTKYWGRNLTTNHTIFATFGNVISPKTRECLFISLSQYPF